MKTNYIKSSPLLMVALFALMAAKAQTTAPGKTAYDDGGYSYDRIHKENGKQVENIQTNWDDKLYKIEFINDKITQLYVDGVKIQAADRDKYSNAIAAIKEQIGKNKEQAKRNEEQARLNQVQDKKNEEQAKRNEEQAHLNQIQEKKNEEQAVRNEEQAQLNQIQEKKNEEQVGRNQEQAAKNEEQARLNEIQAKKNEAQAAENERMMKQMIADLISDKIIPNANSLHDLTFNSDGMTVNGVKQPEDVFKKYKEKYTRFSKGSFSYHNE
jgi:colicin import membrane protein